MKTLPNEIHDEQNGLDYTRSGDYYIPKLAVKDANIQLGRYGKLRKAYLKGYRPVLYSTLVMSERLYEHCAEIEQAALSRLEIIISELARDAGATEALKISDPLKWVGLMNTCKAQAEEIVFHDLICG